MQYRVFTQDPTPRLALDEARGLAGGAFDFVEVHRVSGAPLPFVRLGLVTPGSAAPPTPVTILCRFRSDQDLEEARKAATAGRSAGMDALAERCPTVYEVSFEPGSDERVLLELCAALAAVGLGPILPPDGTALLGVRSARLRARR